MTVRFLVRVTGDPEREAARVRRQGQTPRYTLLQSNRIACIPSRFFLEKRKKEVSDTTADQPYMATEKVEVRCE
jgi:hypothetical protein